MRESDSSTATRVPRLEYVALTGRFAPPAAKETRTAHPEAGRPGGTDRHTVNDRLIDPAGSAMKSPSPVT